MPRPGQSALSRPSLQTAGLGGALRAGDIWFDCTSVTTSGGLVTAFVDRNNALNTLAAANSARRVATPAIDSGFANALTVSCSTAEYLSNQAASFWNFVHDGTGFEWFFVGSQAANALFENYIFDQGGLNGDTYLGDAAAMRLRGENSNYEITSAGENSIGRIWVAHGLVAGQADYLAGTMQGSSFTLRRRSSTIGSASTWSAPGSGAAPGSLMLLNDGFGNYWVGKFACALFFRRVLSTSDCQKVQSYIQSTYGVPP